MPLVGMHQTVTVTKAGASDGWGHEKPGEAIEYTVRVSEQTKIVKNNLGKEAVSSMTILFDRLPDISYDDTIEFTNELGVEIKRKPLAIQPKRLLSGRATITEVNV